MKLIGLFVKTFKNIPSLSVAFIYIGLEFTAGLLAISLILTLLQGHYGDYMQMIASANGAKDAAFSCGVLSLVAALLCDAAVKDREKQS